MKRLALLALLISISAEAKIIWVKQLGSTRCVLKTQTEMYIVPCKKVKSIPKGLKLMGKKNLGQSPFGK